MGLKTKELELTNIKKINVLNKGITKGQKGSIFISRDKIIKAPVFVKSVKDTTGSGDAFFVITSLLLMENAPNLLIPFFGNLYAGMHGQNLGNENIISKKKILENFNSIRKF